MLTINKIFPQEKIPEKTESFLFFDIETTGFSRDNTILSVSYTHLTLPTN